jgi:hypothetical protein
MSENQQQREWFATDLRSDGKRIRLTLSPENADGVWITTRPSDNDGEFVSVAHQPSAIVADLVTGKVYRVQRVACGGGCMCDLSAVELDKASTARFRKAQAKAAKIAVGLGLPADTLGRSIREDTKSFPHPSHFYIITGFKKGQVIARRADGGEYLFPPADVLACWAAAKAAEEDIERRVTEIKAKEAAAAK